jgi:hypothetical protein
MLVSRFLQKCSRARAILDTASRLKRRFGLDAGLVVRTVAVAKPKQQHVQVPRRRRRVFAWGQGSYGQLGIVGLKSSSSYVPRISLAVRL